MPRRPPTFGPVLAPALKAAIRLDRIASPSDVGLLLQPNATLVHAYRVGSDRLRQMERYGWVVPGELGGWLVTDEGRAEAGRMAT